MSDYKSIDEYLEKHIDDSISRAVQIGCPAFGWRPELGNA